MFLGGSAGRSARCLAPQADPVAPPGAVMLGSSAPGPVAREAGSALLTLQQTALQEDQENINPEKAAAAQQPRTRAGLAVLKAGNSRGPALQQRPKTRRVNELLSGGGWAKREFCMGLDRRGEWRGSISWGFFGRPVSGVPLTSGFLQCGMPHYSHSFLPLVSLPALCVYVACLLY